MQVLNYLSCLLQMCFLLYLMIISTAEIIFSNLVIMANISVLSIVTKLTSEPLKTLIVIQTVVFWVLTQQEPNLRGTCYLHLQIDGNRSRDVPSKCWYPFIRLHSEITIWTFTTMKRWKLMSMILITDNKNVSVLGFWRIRFNSNYESTWRNCAKHCTSVTENV